MLTKNQSIGYWVSTVILAAGMGLGAIPDVLLNKMAVEGIHVQLGYPVYFLVIIGVAKILGSIAILVPSFRRLKEWAYAGLAYDLIAATISIFAAHQPPANAIASTVGIIILAISYSLWQKKIQA